MGDDERSSSGGGVAMIVIAILGGLLLVGCCGGLVVIGGGFFAYRSARDSEMEVIKAQDASRQSLERAQREMDEKMEAIGIPAEPTAVQPLDSAPVPPPSIVPEKKE